MYIYLSKKELRPPDELKRPQYFGLDLFGGTGRVGEAWDGVGGWVGEGGNRTQAYRYMMFMNYQ